MIAARSHRSLRGKLLSTYVVALLAGLAVFALAAVFSIDRTLRNSLDLRLSTAAEATDAFIDVRNGKPRVDPDDRRQFLKLMGVQLDGAILDARGRVLASNAPTLAPGILALARSGSARYASLGRNDAELRAFAIPIVRNGRIAGSVVTWRASDYIDELDRDAMVAFAAAALLIAGLAVGVGNAVTRRALEDAFARQRRFTADASHELRAPLAVIRAEADLALRRERSGEAYRDALQTIAAEADRIEELIDDLLAAARAEAGHLERKPLDLEALCGRVCDRMRPAAQSKRVELRLHAQRDVRAMADAAALERALMALVHNAVKFAPPGGRVDVRVRRMGDECEIAVFDDGPGFSAGALEHAFERFWRDDAARSSAGTGLGLAIAKSIVEAFGGRIALANMASGGAEVHCRLPAPS